MQITEEEYEAVKKHLGQAVARAYEMGLESIQVITTASLNGDCMRGDLGFGPFYARLGATESWVTAEKAADLRIDESEDFEDGSE